MWEVFTKIVIFLENISPVLEYFSRTGEIFKCLLFLQIWRNNNHFGFNMYVTISSGYLGKNNKWLSNKQFKWMENSLWRSSSMQQKEYTAHMDKQHNLLRIRLPKTI